MPSGETGRIFVGNEMLFEGYTGGGTQGRASAASWPPATSATSTTPARLFVEGRDDEMIVSGGENVFPQEVEDLLATARGDRRGRGGRRAATRSSASA